MNAHHSELPARLRLADHLRACVVEDQLVMLDLVRGRYFGLDGRHAAIVIEAMNGEGHLPAGGEDPLVEPLVRKGILTCAPDNASVQHEPIPAPANVTAYLDSTDTAGIGLGDPLRFLIAISMAAGWLRWRSLRSITSAVESLRLRTRSRTGADDERRVRRAVAVFDRMRPLAFTSQEKCLFDSLALMIFLSRMKLPARWVIGVSIHPFKAHSWIQRDGDVLNDVPESVRRFTPILIV